MLKAGTTAEQGEKRIRERPREAETFLRYKRKEGQNSTPHSRIGTKGHSRAGPTWPGQTPREQQSRPGPWSPGRAQPPAPRGAAPATTGGVPDFLPHTERPPPPAQAPGIAQLPSPAQPAPLPHRGLRLPGHCGGRTTRRLRYSPAPLCFPSGPHGQEPPAASARSPQGLRRCRCPRSGPGPAGWG